MIRKCSFKNGSIARHEKFWPKVLQEIKSQEIQVGIRGLKLYDDFPEDDEMTVLE